MKLVTHTLLDVKPFASSTELKLLTNNGYNLRRTIYPYYNVDGKGWRTYDKVIVGPGSRLLFCPRVEFHDSYIR